MSWARFDDQIGHHPKTVAAGNEAFGVWVRMVAHCCAYLTDGYVSPAVAVTLSGGGVGGKKILDRLVAVGFLHATEDGGFEVHDFGDWNPSAEEVKAKREADRARKGGSKKPRTPDGSVNLPRGKSAEPARNPAERPRRSSDRIPEDRGRASPVPVPVPVPDQQASTPQPPATGGPPARPSERRRIPAPRAADDDPQVTHLRSDATVRALWDDGEADPRELVAAWRAEATRRGATDDDLDDAILDALSAVGDALKRPKGIEIGKLGPFMTTVVEETLAREPETPGLARTNGVGPLVHTARTYG